MVREMKILVTGGAGFIGSNLCEALLKDSQHVVCLDNFLTGKKENLENCFAHAQFTFIHGDICNMEDCQRAMSGCEAVVHLAALGSVPRSIDDPVTANRINTDGFLNVLQTATEMQIQRFVFAASSSTYGDSEELPKVEERIGKPLSPYAVGKYVNELYAHVYHKNYDFPYIGLRYFNVFGKRQDPNGAYAAVIPKFIQEFLDGRSPLIHGDGSNTRDFTHVENVIDATLKALFNESNEAKNQIYNVAYGTSTNLNQLADYIKTAILHRQPDRELPAIKYGPFRQGDIPHSVASIDKIKRMLGYTPLISVQEGIQKTVDWMLNSES